eukprot:8886579-Ditylum_brightwellii.AAC.1
MSESDEYYDASMVELNTPPVSDDDTSVWEEEWGEFGMGSNSCIRYNKINNDVSVSNTYTQKEEASVRSTISRAVEWEGSTL